MASPQTRTRGHRSFRLCIVLVGFLCCFVATQGVKIPASAQSAERCTGSFVFGSSQSPGYETSKLTDGDVNTSARTQFDENEWWVIDLGDIYEIDTLDITADEHWESDPPMAISLLVTDWDRTGDPANLSVWSQSLPASWSSPGTVHTFSVGQLQAQYVVFHAANFSGRIGLAEVGCTGSLYVSPTTTTTTIPGGSTTTTIPGVVGNYDGPTAAEFADYAADFESYSTAFDEQTVIFEAHAGTVELAAGLLTFASFALFVASFGRRS